MITRFLLSLALALGLQAQNAPTYFTATTGDVSLSSAGTTATIQAAATNPEQTQLLQALVYCSVACSITQAQNGAAATATAGTITAIIPTQNIPFNTTFWTASNVGSGTAIGGIVHLTAAGSVLLDLTNVKLGAGGTSNNYSITIGAITGTANITFKGVRQ